jgi:hypothetical protein
MTRVAIVNDDHMFIELVADLLEEQGWESVSPAGRP